MVAFAAGLSRNALIGARCTTSEGRISSWGQQFKSQTRSFSAFSISADTVAASTRRTASVIWSVADKRVY